MFTPFIPPPRGAKDLVGAMIFNTGGILAIGHIPQRVVWTNPTGKALTIRMASHWTGVAIGHRCDSHGEVFRSDGSVLIACQWDHYAEPTSPLQVTQTYDPGFILKPREQLFLDWFANPAGVLVHHAVRIWWTY